MCEAARTRRKTARNLAKPPANPAKCRETAAKKLRIRVIDPLAVGFTKSKMTCGTFPAPLSNVLTGRGNVPGHVSNVTMNPPLPGDILLTNRLYVTWVSPRVTTAAAQTGRSHDPTRHRPREVPNQQPPCHHRGVLDIRARRDFSTFTRVPGGRPP